MEEKYKEVFNRLLAIGFKDDEARRLLTQHHPDFSAPVPEADASAPIKNDRLDNKPRWELLPLDLVEALVNVYTFGAQKYTENTWQNLPDGYRRYKAALFRHILAYERGEVNDPESGLEHLAHAAWNALVLIHFSRHDKNP